jgi:hypothetical protein
MGRFLPQCRNKPDFESPQWHADILRTRGKNLKQGKDQDTQICPKRLETLYIQTLAFVLVAYREKPPPVPPLNHPIIQ